MWLWIGMYMIIAIFLFRKYRLSFVDYFWTFLPIQFYGVEIGNFLLKPYMIFTIIILFKNLGICFFEKRVMSLLVTYVLLQSFVDLLNDSNMQSYLNQGTFVLAIVCALVYQTEHVNEGMNTSIDNTVNSIIVSGLAYGLTTVIVFAVHNMELNLPALVAHSRSEAGVFLEQSNMVNEALYIGTRYRGFTGDPNLVTASLILPCVLSVYYVNKSSVNRLRNLILIIMSIFVVFITNSRTGIIAISIAILFSNLLVGNRKGIKWFTLAIVALAFGIWFSFSDFNILSLYSGRASLTSERGRFTIWLNAINTLNEHNPLFGIGTARLASADYQSIFCHNTWLEWICGNGWIFGTIVALFFLFEGWKKYRLIKHIDLSLASALLVGYYSIWFTLLTVDAVADVSFLFLLAFMSIVITRNKYHME